MPNSIASEAWWRQHHAWGAERPLRFRESSVALTQVWFAVISVSYSVSC